MNWIGSKTISLKRRSDLHLARKIWHTSGVLVIAILHNNLPHQLAVQLLLSFWALFVSIDVLRLFNPKLNDGVLIWFQFIMRQNERDNLAGTTYLLSGVLAILLVFPKPIVALSLLFLAFGDPLASYFGIRYGHEKLIGKKTLQGTVAAFMVCSLLSLFFFFANGLMLEHLLAVTLLSGIGGAIAELIPFGKIDDNLTFPVISAVFLNYLFHSYGGFL